MVDDKTIERINELAAKAKTPEGLTDEEKDEQARLRKAFLESVRSQVKDHLSRIKIVDEDDKLDN